MTAEEKKVIFASSLGTVFEWYDFYLYGSLAGFITQHFFSGVNETTGYIFALLAFAAGFAVRPFGAIVFGRLGDRWGRKNTFLATMMLMGLSTFVDISSFTLIAILVARLGIETVAGHRVIANFTGLIYMLPLALSIATMVLVGQAVGANDPARARLTARVGMGLTGVLAVLLGTVLWLLRERPHDLGLKPYGAPADWVEPEPLVRISPDVYIVDDPPPSRFIAVRRPWTTRPRRPASIPSSRSWRRRKPRGSFSISTFASGDSSPR